VLDDEAHEAHRQDDADEQACGEHAEIAQRRGHSQHEQCDSDEGERERRQGRHEVTRHMLFASTCWKLSHVHSDSCDDEEHSCDQQQPVSEQHVT
jgi:hypothetical protein